MSLEDRVTDLIVEQLGLKGLRGVSTPGTDALEDIDPAIEEVELPVSEKTLYRAIAARCN